MDDQGVGGDVHLGQRLHHERYYLHDVVFLVENQLFRVPRYMFEHESAVFADMFSIPAGPSGPEGQTDAAPIRLQQVTCADFERLLGLLYPLTPHFRTFADSWGPVEWASILHLATRWDMFRIRTVAIEVIDRTLSPVAKVCLGKEYSHLPLEKEGFAALCLRPEPLTEEEGCQLGLKRSIQCAAARERVRAKVVKWRAANTLLQNKLGSLRYIDQEADDDEHRYLKDPRVEKIIEDIFGFPPQTHPDTPSPPI